MSKLTWLYTSIFSSICNLLNEFSLGGSNQTVLGGSATRREMHQPAFGTLAKPNLHHPSNYHVLYLISQVKADFNTMIDNYTNYFS